MIMRTGELIRVEEKQIVGMRMRMSMAEYKVGELWRSFMPRRMEVQNRVSDDLISAVVYHEEHFIRFNPARPFEKWAGAEVSVPEGVPEGMEILVIPAGLYAVFDYKGSSTDPGIFQFIFGSWLPQSGLIPDNRPHFEVLGPKYRNNDPESEEEIWIPVRTA